MIKSNQRIKRERIQPSRLQVLLRKIKCEVKSHEKLIKLRKSNEGKKEKKDDEECKNYENYLEEDDISEGGSDSESSSNDFDVTLVSKLHCFHTY